MIILELRTVSWHAVLIAVLIHGSSGDNSTEPEKNPEENREAMKKVSEGTQIASKMIDILIEMWTRCVISTMPGKSFLVDNIQNYVNHPARTTIGFAPKFTANRKFLGNLISSTAFKTMLDKDENELRLALISKLKYCDEAIMDQDILKDFYDREVDISKLRKK